MQLLSENVSTWRKKQEKGQFSTQFAASVSIQMLKAIEAFHKAGFVHRDIKPSNFNRLRYPKIKYQVNLIDFGLAKTWIDFSTGLPLKKEEKGEFYGTSLYASVNTHYQNDMSRLDDLWSFLFVVIDLVTGSLPWKSLYKEFGAAMSFERRRQILPLKLNFINHPPDSLLPELNHFMQHLKSLTFYKSPDYDYLISLLYRISINPKYNSNSLNNLENRIYLDPKRQQVCTDLIRSGSCCGCCFFHPQITQNIVQIGRVIPICIDYIENKCPKTASQCHLYHWTSLDESRYRRTGLLPAQNDLIISNTPPRLNGQNTKICINYLKDEKCIRNNSIGCRFFHPKTKFRSNTLINLAFPNGIDVCYYYCCNGKCGNQEMCKYYHWNHLEEKCYRLFGVLPNTGNGENRVLSYKMVKLLEETGMDENLILSDRLLRETFFRTSQSAVKLALSEFSLDLRFTNSDSEARWLRTKLLDYEQEIRMFLDSVGFYEYLEMNNKPKISKIKPIKNVSNHPENLLQNREIFHPKLSEKLESILKNFKKSVKMKYPKEELIKLSKYDLNDALEICKEICSFDASKIASFSGILKRTCLKRDEIIEKRNIRQKWRDERISSAKIKLLNNEKKNQTNFSEKIQKCVEKKPKIPLQNTKSLQTKDKIKKIKEEPTKNVSEKSKNKNNAPKTDQKLKITNKKVIKRKNTTKMFKKEKIKNRKIIYSETSEDSEQSLSQETVFSLHSNSLLPSKSNDDNSFVLSDESSYEISHRAVRRSGRTKHNRETQKKYTENSDDESDIQINDHDFSLNNRNSLSNQSKKLKKSIKIWRNKRNMLVNDMEKNDFGEFIANSEFVSSIFGEFNVFKCFKESEKSILDQNKTEIV